MSGYDKKPLSTDIQTGAVCISSWNLEQNFQKSGGEILPELARRSLGPHDEVSFCGP